MFNAQRHTSVSNCERMDNTIESKTQTDGRNCRIDGDHRAFLQIKISMSTLRIRFGAVFKYAQQQR